MIGLNKKNNRAQEHISLMSYEKQQLEIERFSNDCRKTNTKVITLTNHKRSKQRDQPIRIPSNYLQLVQSAGKIARTHQLRLVLILLLIG